MHWDQLGRCGRVASNSFYERNCKKRNRRILLTGIQFHIYIKPERYSRIEKVLSILAPNPLKKPETPSSFKIFTRSLIIDSWDELVLGPFPLLSLVDDEAACIRVLTLENIRPSDTQQKIIQRTCREDTRRYQECKTRKGNTNQHTTHALLKTPPSAPANACPNGVSSSTGFEAATMEVDEWSQPVGIDPVSAVHVKAVGMI